MKYPLVAVLLTGVSMHSESLKQPQLYDVVGKTYDETRCADPAITQALVKHLSPQSGGKYIDVCCGSGNYTVAINACGIALAGVDISQEMLTKARAKNSSISWIHGDAQNLPFANESFDGALCINAIHHLKDLSTAFVEIYRILNPGSRLVIFTSSPEQCLNSWLVHYFPFIGELGKKWLPTEELITEHLQSAGFSTVHFERFFVSNDTKDLYLYTGKYRPEIYFDPVVRAGMTPFNKPEYAQEIAEGLAQLDADMRSGMINEIIAAHESDLGENVFIVAEKQ